MTSDWREQEYEDNYWNEWDQRDSAIRAAVSTWDDSTSDLFIAAVEQAGRTRAEERAYVIEDLLER